MKKIVIIGGGASGMMAAIAAAQKNPAAKICILEQKEMIGKKILSTGNGRCNFTNEFMESGCFRSDNPEAIDTVLKHFGTEDTLKFFRNLGMIPSARNGYYYPRSNQASSVLELLKIQLKLLGVKIHTGVHVKKIERKKSGFKVYVRAEKSEEKNTKKNSEKSTEKVIGADAVILSSGAKAAPVLGSDGSGYDLAKSLGHSISPVVPALVQLRVKNHPLSKASGVRTEATVRIFENDKLMGEDTGELQITAYGISGIPVFQVSRYAAKSLYYKHHTCASLDFFPDITEKDFVSLLRDAKNGREGLTVFELLVGMLNQKLIPCLLTCSNIRPQLKAHEFTDEKITKFAHTCKQLSLEIEDTNGFENAQICAGGVRLNEINPDTMESLFCENLYLTGELLDADGICGGYNLQWAWASGYLAGCNAVKEK